MGQIRWKWSNRNFGWKFDRNFISEAEMELRSGILYYCFAASDFFAICKTPSKVLFPPINPVWSWSENRWCYETRIYEQKRSLPRHTPRSTPHLFFLHGQTTRNGGARQWERQVPLHGSGRGARLSNESADKGTLWILQSPAPGKRTYLIESPRDCSCFSVSKEKQSDEANLNIVQMAFPRAMLLQNDDGPALIMLRTFRDSIENDRASRKPNLEFRAGGWSEMEWDGKSTSTIWASASINSSPANLEAFSNCIWKVSETIATKILRHPYQARVCSTVG